MRCFTQDDHRRDCLLTDQSDLPDGEPEKLLSSSPRKKILLFRNANPPYIPLVLFHRGALSIVTDVGRDVVDADGAGTKASEADSEVVWF
jgi:hypothetical protein